MIETTAFHGLTAMQEVANKLPGTASYVVLFFVVLALYGQLNRLNRTLIRIALALENKT